MAFKISIEEQSKLFRQHLEEEGNDRIIFSGAFGTGKTYFLENFFLDNKKDFLTIKLSPVNYSVSSNEDIFKLVKYDILFELLLSHGLKLEGEQISRNVAYGLLLPAKAEAIMKGMFSIISLLNKDIESIPIILTTFTEWFNTIKEIEKQRKDASQENEVGSFLEEISGTYSLEQDEITSFIKQSLETLLEANKNKYKILIIEDLDRIDPEHTFRLFNIFSAHLDYHRTYKNKFGFDKVIFVCDIQNVRNSFHNRYGTETDFTGYIDKFYNKEVFEFNNKSEVKKISNKLINTIQYNEEYEEYFRSKILKGDRGRNQSLLEIIILELIANGSFNIRRIKESYGIKYRFDKQELEAISFGNRLYKPQIPALIVLEIISKMLGGSEALYKAAKSLTLATSTEFYLEFTSRHSDWLAGMIIPLSDYRNHRFRTDTAHILSINNIHLSYTLIETGNERNQYYARINSLDGIPYNDSTPMRIDFFYLLVQAIDEMRKAGILR
ncbi:MAG: P-loop NTPase fold protein [Janthinobacterium lividum]